MGTVFSQYLGTLARLAAGIACTDRAGRDLGGDPGFAAAVDLLAVAHRAGRTVHFVGNGGSAAIASHGAVDFFNAGMRSRAFNDGSLLTCLANDFGYEEVFARPLALVADPGDVLVAISSGGRSRNILAAVAAARERGCAVVTLSGFDADNPLRALGDVNFHVASHSYGFVECLHQTICHGLFDCFLERVHGRPVPH
ncbi:MAG TPA: SIS domain-containing protein [Candidatus Methanoperedens sp.]|nr:SIS domain-containing protein [Candidatus Methanoperedens sp.]